MKTLMRKLMSDINFMIQVLYFSVIIMATGCMGLYTCKNIVANIPALAGNHPVSGQTILLPDLS
jgi:hypothetical protein